MQDLQVEGSASSPAIAGNCSTGQLTIAGESYPENASGLYRPVIRWMEDFLMHGNAPLHLRLDLLYLNTSSVRAMMDLLDVLEQAHRRGQAVAVEWRYEPGNEQVIELADEFREDYTFTFDIVPNGGVSDE